MQIYPAIDIRDGKCVRLKQGDYSKETVFGSDPVEVAKRWVAEGADFLHLVDLDGAKAGKPINSEIAARIVHETGVRCQIGGGIRDELAIRETLDLGIERVIIGTQALKHAQWFAQMAKQFPGKLVLGLDANNGLVATAGWLDVSKVPAVDFVRQFDPMPLAAVIFTDIAKDGMMKGPNFNATVEIQSATRHPVIASGGISIAEDVYELARRGIGGCILGRSIYEGTVNLRTLFEYFESIGSDKTEFPKGSGIK